MAVLAKQSKTETGRTVRAGVFWVHTWVKTHEDWAGKAV